MKKYLLLFVFMIFGFLPLTVNAQCKEFTENEALPLLGDFILSGRYNAVKLYEGEEILVFKTLSKGITYRFIVKGSSDLPKNIEFEVRDWNGNPIFLNKDKNYTSVWDYNCDKTQRIKVFVKVPVVSKSKEPQSGCITLVTGIKKI